MRVRVSLTFKSLHLALILFLLNGMGKRWLDHSLNSVDPARGSNATINKTKSLDWVWLTAIDPYMLLSSDHFNLDDCHRVAHITKQ